MRAGKPCGTACKNGVQKRPQAFLYPEIKRFFRSQLRSPVRSVRRVRKRSAQLRGFFASVRRVTLWMVPSGS